MAETFDIAIVGAGITGCAIARQLARFELSICVVEAANDIALGASKANGGLVHAGYDPAPGTVKAQVNARGCELYGAWAQELGFLFCRTGSMVLGFNDEDRAHLEQLLCNGLANGVPELSIVGPDRIHELESRASADATCALWCPSTGFVDPFEVAIAALTGNCDTQNRNCYLYSPLNSKVWYILDWDNDGMLRKLELSLTGFSDYASWERGASNYWGNVLFNRALRSKSFRSELDRAVKDLRSYLTETRLTKMIKHYREVTESLVFASPDIDNLPVTKDQYEQIAAAIPSEIEENYKSYRESFKKPMPFYIGVPQIAAPDDCARYPDAARHGVHVCLDFYHQRCRAGGPARDGSFRHRLCAPVVHAALRADCRLAFDGALYRALS